MKNEIFLSWFLFLYLSLGERVGVSLFQFRTYTIEGEVNVFEN
jgi:hypothetical protein